MQITAFLHFINAHRSYNNIHHVWCLRDHVAINLRRLACRWQLLGLYCLPLLVLVLVLRIAANSGTPHTSTPFNCSKKCWDGLGSVGEWRTVDFFSSSSFSSSSSFEFETKIYSCWLVGGERKTVFGTIVTETWIMLINRMKCYSILNYLRVYFCWF